LLLHKHDLKFYRGADPVSHVSLAEEVVYVLKRLVSRNPFIFERRFDTLPQPLLSKHVHSVTSPLLPISASRITHTYSDPKQRKMEAVWVSFTKLVHNNTRTDITPGILDSRPYSSTRSSSS